MPGDIQAFCPLLRAKNLNVPFSLHRSPEPERAISVSFSGLREGSGLSGLGEESFIHGVHLDNPCTMKHLRLFIKFEQESHETLPSPPSFWTHQGCFILLI